MFSTSALVLSMYIFFRFEQPEKTFAFIFCIADPIHTAFKLVHFAKQAFAVLEDSISVTLRIDI